MMQCDFPKERLSAFIDGELDELDAEATRKHLTQCDACKGAVESFVALGSALSVLLTDISAPDSTEQSVWASLEMARHDRQARHLFETYVMGLGVSLMGVIFLMISPLGRFVLVGLRLITATFHGLLVLSSMLHMVWMLAIGAFMVMLVTISLIVMRRMLQFARNEAVL